jgi:hypothetical protein
MGSWKIIGKMRDTVQKREGINLRWLLGDWRRDEKRAGVIDTAERR